MIHKKQEGIDDFEAVLAAHAEPPGFKEPAEKNLKKLLTTCLIRVTIRAFQTKTLFKLKSVWCSQSSSVQAARIFFRKCMIRVLHVFYRRKTPEAPAKNLPSQTN